MRILQPAWLCVPGSLNAAGVSYWSQPCTCCNEPGGHPDDHLPDKPGIALSLCLRGAGRLPCCPHALIECLSCRLQHLMLRICSGACKVRLCVSVLLLAAPHLKHLACHLQARSSGAALWPWELHADSLPCCLQGLTLNEPEVVPFRLTQNMIDAFGVAGVEGVFRKTCEVSLEVSSLLCNEVPSCFPCFSGLSEGLSIATGFS